MQKMLHGLKGADGSKAPKDQEANQSNRISNCSSKESQISGSKTLQKQKRHYTSLSKESVGFRRRPEWPKCQCFSLAASALLAAAQTNL